jgi:hypothetical protein
MRKTAQERYSVRDIRARWLALKLNIVGVNGSRRIRPPSAAPLRGYPADSSGPGYHHSAAPA